MNTGDITGVLYANRVREYSPVYAHDVVYAHRDSGDLTLQILTPEENNYHPASQHSPSVFDEIREKALKEGREVPFRPMPANRHRFPLIVDVPGSGWSGNQGYEHMAAMMKLSRAGYVTASVKYRGPFRDDVRFPAAVQDVKEAVRFLRAHADEFLVDVDRVALLGDSSGGHTAAMAALTGDEPRFSIGENSDQTAAVKSCVIYYGPNDLNNLVADRIAEGKTLRPGEGKYPFEAREIFKDDYLADPEGMFADASPVNYISAEKKMPPFLFLNGDDDPIIPLAQGIRFCNKMKACGGKAEFYKIVGGGHGVGCWTEETEELILRFFKATL